MSYLLDSVIVTDYCNGIAAATRFIREHADTHAVSAITRAEVLVGFAQSSIELGTALLDSFRFLPMDAAVADAAAALRRQTRLKLPDAIQAGFALHYNLTLATHNTRDFPPGKFDFVYVPYTLG